MADSNGHALKNIRDKSMKNIVDAFAYRRYNCMHVTAKGLIAWLLCCMEILQESILRFSEKKFGIQ